MPTAHDLMREAGLTPPAPTPQPTFAEALDGIYRERYTGAFTVHCIHGVPTAIERPNPIRIKLRRT